MGIYRARSGLADHLLDQRAAISRRDAIETYGVHALRACVARKSVVRILPETYVHASVAADRLVRMRAASVWAAPRGALTGMAAAWAWGLLEVPPGRVTVQFPQPLHLQRPAWLRVIRPDLDTTVFGVRGLRVVHRDDALIQVWCEAGPSDRIGRIVDAVRLGNLRADDLRAAAQRRKRVKARGELDSVLGLLDGGVQSYLEFHARKYVFTDREFPELVRQHRVVAAGKTRALDAYAPDIALVLEFDGRATHSRESDRLSDIERDAELATLGMAVIRFTYADLMERPEWCKQVYRTARAARIAAITVAGGARVA